MFCGYPLFTAELFPLRPLNPDLQCPELTRNHHHDAGWFSPVVDQVELADTPEVLARTGRINNVDHVLLGTNLNEARLLMPIEMPVPNAPASSPADIRAWLNQNYPLYDAEEVMLLYAEEIKANPWLAASLIFTESQYLCPTQASARWLQSAGTVEKDAIFVYQLTYAPEIMALVGDILYWYQWCSAWPDLCPNMTVPFGVAHGSDVPLVWNSNLLNATGQRLARDMIGFWENLAADGAPGRAASAGPGAEPWPPYTAAGATMQLASRSAPATNLDDGRCRFWQTPSWTAQAEQPLQT